MTRATCLAAVVVDICQTADALYTVTGIVLATIEQLGPLFPQVHGLSDVEASDTTAVCWWGCYAVPSGISP